MLICCMIVSVVHVWTFRPSSNRQTGIGTWIKDKKRGIYKVATVGTDDGLRKCQLCKDASDDLKLLNKCKHVFCGTCLDDNIHRALQSNKDGEDYEVCHFGVSSSQGC